MRMAADIAEEMNDGSMDEEDFQGEAYLGLAIALNTCGAEAPDDQIEDIIREHLREALEESRNLYESDSALAYQVNELSRCIEELTKTYGTKPNLDEIANSMGITQEKVIAILKLAGEDLDEGVGAF